MNQNPNEYLYKFYNACGLEHFKNTSLKLSQATEFNDPFELLPNILQKGPGYMDPQTATKILTHKLIKKYYILSLSANPDSVSMWAYYAQMNLGFAVGFRKTSSILKDANCELRRVEYSTLRPWHFLELNLDITEEVLVKAIEDTSIWTKSIEWIHEAEWRLVMLNETYPDGDPIKIISYSPEDVGEIRIGCRMPTKIMQGLLDVLSEPRFRNTDIILQQMSNSKYGYEPVKVSRSAFHCHILNCEEDEAMNEPRLYGHREFPYSDEEYKAMIPNLQKEVERARAYRQARQHL